MHTYIATTTDGHVVGGFDRRRQVEDCSVACAQQLNETIIIKHINVFGDGYEATGLVALPSEKRVRRLLA